jgi:hypothetical protein
MPSVSPSAQPSISAQPSVSPSQSPSALPSAKPSISSQPSAFPSASPSISSQPSSAPTLITLVDANFTVVLRLETGLLSGSQVLAFQNATASFLQTDATIDSGKLQDVSVILTGQKVVDVSNVTTNSTGNTTMRRLQEKSQFSLEQALEVMFSITATYIGSDPGMDLHAALIHNFESPKSRWFRWLGASDPIFEPIAPEPTPEEKAVAAAAAAAKAEQQRMADKEGNGAVTIASFMAVAALILGVVAAVFSIRHYRLNTFGQELSSPRLNTSSSGLGSRIANENLEYEYNSQLERDGVPMKQSISEDENGVEVDSATSSWMHPPKSPNSLENGNVVALDKIMQSQRTDHQPADDRWSRIDQSNSNTSRTSRDPPTERTEVNFPTQSLQADPRKMVSLFDNNVSFVRCAVNSAKVFVVQRPLIKPFIAFL